MNENLKQLLYTIFQRYQTFNPFTITEKLNIEIEWAPLRSNPLGETIYYNKAPIIVLSENIKESPQRFFVLAHEMGHVIEHADVASYLPLAI